MKWFIASFLAMAVVWLVVPRAIEERDRGGFVESSRRVLGAEWRGKPEKEMTIEEMERYAAGLSDEELWGELEKSCENWMALEAVRKWPEQPRLAIMLAREIGKRNGGKGMKKVSKWLEDQDKMLFESGDRSLEMAFHFLEMRVRVASYAGWVTANPDEAISGLIDSRINEDEDWAVVNQGFMMYFKVPEFFAMEAVLREGFRELAGRDFERARELFVAGTGVWAFDANEVVGSLLEKVPREEWSTFFDGIHEEVGQKYGEKKEDGSLDSLAGLLRKKDWVSDYLEILTKERREGLSTGYASVTLALGRPEEAIKALEDEQISNEDKLSSNEDKLSLFSGLVMADLKNYHLLNQLSEADQVLAVLFFSEVLKNDGVLLTGKERSVDFDRQDLISVVENIPMDEVTMARLLDSLSD